MAWQTDMVTLLRAFISDQVSPYTYSDDRLKTVLVAASIPVINEVDFNNTYTIDLSATGITPDPVDGTSEIGFQVLVCRKAAHLIYAGEFRDASNKAINFKDGPSQIDTRGVADSKRFLAGQAAEQYDQARTAYLTGNGLHGAGIVTPFNYGVVESSSNSYGNWS